MNLAPNATFAQFATAYAGALSSLGIESNVQALRSDGTMEYSSEAAEFFDMPLINIDGSRSTAARDSYVLLSAPKEPVALFSRDEQPTRHAESPFISGMNRLESIIFSSTDKIADDLDIPIEKIWPTGMDDWRRQFRSIRQFSLSDIIAGKTPLSDDIIEHLARGIDACASMSMQSSQGDQLRTARLYFISGILFANLEDPKISKKAIRMFNLSSEFFFHFNDHAVTAAIVSEIPVTVSGLAADRMEAYLAHTAACWDKAASSLLDAGDIAGAIITIYRGLRAASLSKNYLAMRHLFELSAAINDRKGNVKEQNRDHLRSALATFNAYAPMAESDENLVWKEAFRGLQFPFELIENQGMTDAIRPFIEVARKRAGMTAS